VLPRVAMAITLLALSAPAAPQQAPAPEKKAMATGTGQPRSPRNANYRILARLDPSARTITGEEVISWRNISNRATTTLQFHLYYNAWRDTHSTWMREEALATGASHDAIEPEDAGSIDIAEMHVTRTGNESNLSSRLRFIAPDDGNARDRTVVEAPLEAPVQPGETVDIRIRWTSHVPRPFARTGAIGNFFFIAQWFPKIGVLQDDGWNCHQFHASTEFFADFGTYDVQLDVPKGWMVGATGREMARTDAAPDRTTHRYVEEDVHDFAWTTSPDYVERRARFEHASLPAVEMRLLLQPEHASQEARLFASTRAALRYYGEWFGAYPYRQITIVDPAWQSGAEGMEYPTLFTAGTRWLEPAGTRDLEDVTVHEAGHQFWYGIVASNEVEHAWLDEGLNTFSTARVLEQAFYPAYYSRRYFGDFFPFVFKDLPLTRDVDGNRMPSYRHFAESDAQSTPSWRYWPGSGGFITYDKTALWLGTLEHMLGWETLRRILSTYYERFAFKHPRPEDFFRTANEVSGQDLTWFFDQVHRSSNAFDYSIELKTPDEDASTVVVRRLGEGVFPVDVRVRLEGGQEQRWHWDGRDRWKAFEVAGHARPLSAEVDPEHVLLLDVNRTNNSVSARPAARAAANKWSLAWLIWLQDHLLTYGFFV
jgi:hypothetical protein